MFVVALSVDYRLAQMITPGCCLHDWCMGAAVSASD